MEQQLFALTPPSSLSFHQHVFSEIVSVNNIRLTGPDWDFRTIMDAIRQMRGSNISIDVFRPSKDWAAASKAQTATVVATSTAASSNVTAPTALPTANPIPQVNLKLRRDPNNAPDQPLAVGLTVYNTARRSPPLIESDVAPAPPPSKEPVPGSSAWCALQKKRKAEEASQINQKKRDREAEPSEANMSSREAQVPAPAEASTLAATSTATNANDIQEEILEPLTSRATGVLLEVEIPPRKEAPSFGMVLEMVAGLPVIQKFFAFSFIGQTGKVKLGDFVLSINGRSTRATGFTFDEVKKAFASVDKDESLTLEILRPTNTADSTGKSYTIIKGISIHRNDEPFGVLVQHDRGDKRGEKTKIFCSGIKPDSPAMREGTLKKFDGEPM